MTPLIERGGLKWGEDRWRGTSGVSWPLATLRATRDELRIDAGAGAIGTSFRFTRAEIASMFLKRHVLMLGLHITHTRSDYPPLIVFWSFRPRRLRSALEALGYSVTR